MFETTGVVDYNTVKEAGFGLLRIKKKWLVIVAEIVLFLVVITSLIVKDYMMTLIAVVILFIYPAECYLILKKSRKRIIDRMLETTGRPYNTYTTTFIQQGVQLYNHDNNGQAVINYDNIVHVQETKNTYILYTQSWQMIFVFKAGLIPQQNQEFIPFLRTLPTRIKW